MTLRAEGVCAQHGDTSVLRDVDLEVGEGEVVAVLGPSGSGKSTLLRVVAGLHRPTAGRVLLGGQDVTHRPPERRRVGLVPQDGALFSHLTVAANAAFGLRVRRRPAEHPRVREVLELVGLAALAHRRPHELSGGQQQRVALARALAPRPRLVLLDEPFSALDADLRARVRDDVVAAVRSEGVASLLVTHDQEEALSTADRVVVLRGGAVVQACAPRELWQRPADAWTASFVGGAAVVPAVPTGPGHLRATTALGEVQLAAAAPAGGAVAVVVRSDQLRLAGAAAPVHGNVVSARYLGHGALVHLDVAAALPGGLPLRLAIRLGPGDAVPHVGERCGLQVVGALHPVVAPEPPGAGAGTGPGAGRAAAERQSR